LARKRRIFRPSPYLCGEDPIEIEGQAVPESDTGLAGGGGTSNVCVCPEKERAGMGRTISTGSEPGGQAKRLASLSGLDGESLKERWRIVYRREPPPRVSESLLLQAIAYRLQEKALGGLKPSTRRLLLRVASDAATDQTTNTESARRLKPGAVLLREWHGVTHQATVLEVGVRFRGQRYRLLSEVARVITGARWSGPLFFRLKSGSRGGPAPIRLTVGDLVSSHRLNLAERSIRALL
jgi:hypothetical protein